MFRRFDIVVNATGVCCDVHKCSSLLVKQLVKDGMIQSCKFGGVALNFNSLETNTTKGLYFIGNFAKGTVFLTSGLGFCRNMVQRVINHISTNILQLL